jgi:hypothetical protein
MPNMTLSAESTLSNKWQLNGYEIFGITNQIWSGFNSKIIATIT